MLQCFQELQYILKYFSRDAVLNTDICSRAVANNTKTISDSMAIFSDQAKGDWSTKKYASRWENHKTNRICIVPL